MTRIEHAIDIAAPAERVFHELETWDGLRRWSTITVDHTGPGNCSHVGQTFEQTIRVAGVDLRTDWVVTEYEPPNLIAYRATGPGHSEMRMRQQVTATTSGSRLDLEVEYELPAGRLGGIVDLLYARRRNQREAERTLTRLKNLLESNPD
jgi:uncharacterized protein YndB with AHSA1/START domain